MSTISKIWDESVPVFLLNTEFNLRKKINLKELSFRVCLELNIKKENVTISYDNYFIKFKEPEVDIKTIKEFFELLQKMWLSISKQCEYEKNCNLEIYGSYTNKLANNKYQVLVALCRRTELVNSLEDINCISLQKAILASSIPLN